MSFLIGTTLFSCFEFFIEINEVSKCFVMPL